MSSWTIAAMIQARAQSARALAVAEQWQQTALLTGNLRHQITAEICRMIARERLVVRERLEAETGPMAGCAPPL